MVFTISVIAFIFLTYSHRHGFTFTPCPPKADTSGLLNCLFYFLPVSPELTESKVTQTLCPQETQKGSIIITIGLTDEKLTIKGPPLKKVELRRNSSGKFKQLLLCKNSKNANILLIITDV